MEVTGESQGQLAKRIRKSETYVFRILQTRKLLAHQIAKRGVKAVAVDDPDRGGALPLPLGCSIIG